MNFFYRIILFVGRYRSYMGKRVSGVGESANWRFGLNEQGQRTPSPQNPITTSQRFPQSLNDSKKSKREVWSLES